jgi:hypothetical protein
MLRITDVLCHLLLTSTAVALPRKLQFVDPTEHGKPHDVPLIDGKPMCDLISGPGAPQGTENMLDAFSEIGSCQKMLDGGMFTCANSFCPKCPKNQYCDGLCGFCNHDDSEVLEHSEHVDPEPEPEGSCSDDEVARASAGITASCQDVATNGLCNELAPLGALDFCCLACQLAQEDHPEFACDENAIITSCADAEATAGLTGTDQAAIIAACSTPCAVAIQDNYDNCMQNVNSIVFEERVLFHQIIVTCQDIGH